LSNNNQTILSLESGDALLGRYVLDHILGEGGMAAVWLATDLNLDRPVAIKVLPTALSRDTRSITRLKAEANRNLDLPHANIVRLYSFEQDPVRGNQAFLVMQYVEGRTLHELLAEHPDGLPKKQLQKWSAQIASAIDFAHKRGVLHRDIKPSNIIIEKATGDAYLMDFGIARETRDTMTMVTGRQESSGTLPYMSPQQLVGKNHKSNDIYSFAATLYEGFCGHPPFRTGDIAYQIREIDAEPIEALSKAANAALLAGLAKDSDKRPETCERLLRVSFSHERVDKTTRTKIVVEKKVKGSSSVVRSGVTLSESSIAWGLGGNKLAYSDIISCQRGRMKWVRSIIISLFVILVGSLILMSSLFFYETFRLWGGVPVGTIGLLSALGGISYIITRFFRFIVGQNCTVEITTLSQIESIEYLRAKAAGEIVCLVNTARQG